MPGMPTPHRPVRTDGALLMARDLFKIYKTDDLETVVLRGAHLRVKAGEFVAILGRSGAGKTTLLNLIGGIDTPTAGQLVIRNTDISKLDEAERGAFRRAHIGIIFQTGNLLPFLTALENVTLPMRWAGAAPGEAHSRAAGLLTRLGLGERLNHKASQLSGGEAQRVGIAIALANDPDLLLADELTGELDTETAERVMSTLDGLHRERGTTLVVVTHNSRIAARADRIVHLNGGFLEENGHD
ncbi:MAG: ABC transporter ATP-binding protein [Chloroflexi bacterium]|nr:ABC transporter ATP-binding protein [Chloroflexota bacterium]